MPTGCGKTPNRDLELIKNHVKYILVFALTPPPPSTTHEYIHINTYKKDNKSRSKEMIFSHTPSHTHTEMKWLLFLLIFVHECLYVPGSGCVFGWVSLSELLFNINVVLVLAIFCV